jgi:VIT1/CCC1 family predicted Fe2+/Mn2+ transporter
MGAIPVEERQHLLDPVDRISEVLFGLIMAVTIVGSLSIATAERAEVRTVLYAALGCNVAWGLVDALMYLMRTATERSRLRALGQRIRQTDAATGQALVAGAMPEHFGEIVGADELDAIRRRILARPAETGSVLRSRDFSEAVAVFALVVLATFPVVVPFLVMQDAPRAFQMSRVITVVMLGLAGAALGRYAAHSRPLVTGASMAVFGVLLIGAVKALGG